MALRIKVEGVHSTIPPSRWRPSTTCMDFSRRWNVDVLELDIESQDVGMVCVCLRLEVVRMDRRNC